MADVSTGLRAIDGRLTPTVRDETGDGFRGQWEGNVSGVGYCVRRGDHWIESDYDVERPLTEPETVVAQRAEIADLRERLGALVKKHDEEMARVVGKYEDHLAKIAHGDCISTEAHKRITRELRERART